MSPGEFMPRGRRSHRRRTRHSRLASAGFAIVLTVSGAALTTQAAGAAGSTVVSLTFDNDTLSEYTLGYQQALQPHGAAATFYVNSGSVTNSSSAKYMSWSQISALAAAGNAIGGKTVDGTTLTTLTTSQQISEICNDRQNLLHHGLAPASFAYPGGAFSTTIESEAQNCGYGNARTAGSLSPTGSLYAETLPPKNWLALRAYSPTGQVSLASLESLVSGAATHGGGWIPIVIGKVCSQAQDPSNYSTCTASSGWIDLGDLNTFLSWVQSAGQPGGAPAGTSFSTMQGVASSVDTIPPVTTISCNGAPCASTTYTSTVSVSMAPTDLGSGVASTHYTTDGTTPALTSPAYTGPFPLTSTSTVRFRSWDSAGNAESVETQTIPIQQPPDSTPPATTISCNGGSCSSTAYTAPVTVTLNAADNPGGWGVANTYYTTDGSTPTTSSTVYTGPFTVKQNATVKFFSADLAGNAEQVNSQTINFTIVVSLTFDDGIDNQYTLAFQDALQPHHMNGTFFVNTTGISQGLAAGAMTWQQLTALNNAGNEIGGHTLGESNLTTDDTQTATQQVCQDRQNLISHGFYPTSFAYPFGAYNATAESIVSGCGYTSGRAAGGIDVSGPGAGPVYAEPLPPKDPLATRTVYNAPTGNPLVAPMLTLSSMEGAITAASQNGGGWIQLAFHQICSQALDPANYSTCTGSWGPVELDTLNTLLTWLQNAGQSGGAPTGTVVKTVSQVIDGPDTQAPVTTLDCDGSPCQSPAYGGSTTVSLVPTDPGSSGVAATYYTTDGSTPATSSPTYLQPFTINRTTTFKFFSVDNAGNVEAVNTQTVSVQPNPDRVVGAAGDIACDPGAAGFNGGAGTATDCREASTAGLLTGVDAVLPLGDDQYYCGGLTAFQQSFGPTWGVKRSIMYPVPGDQDLHTSGGTGCPSTPGAYYQQYFSTSGSWYGSPLPSVVNVDPNVSYYSFNLGTWHIIALNTGMCELQQDEQAPLTFCAAGSPMDQWLRNDLANNTASCTLVDMQDPRWASNPSGDGGDSTYQQLWQDIYNGGADVVMAGNDHWYERFAPLNAAGQIDNTYGVREFIAGTGGEGLEQPGAEASNSQVLNDTTHGILKLTLHNGSYDWQFVNDGESSFTDSGTGTCHAKPLA